MDSGDPMSKIEKTLIWAKEKQREADKDAGRKQRFGAERYPHRRVSRENDGAKWIETLRIEPSHSTESSESKVILDDSQDERIRSAYKMLRTRTLQRMRQNDWHIIGVTSPSQGDGKSLTSVNLALSLAREVTLSVVLLELDLRRPTICDQFGVSPSKGISHYIDGKAKLNEVLFRPEATERLAVLPNTEIYENSSETLSSPKVATLVDELRGTDPGRAIICDLPPYLATDDVLAFAPLADAFLIVISEGKTSRDALAKGMDILQDLPVLGVVLNRSEEATTGYYY
jgi:capsular exopolysaccharide synthesis family protein